VVDERPSAAIVLGENVAMVEGTALAAAEKGSRSVIRAMARTVAPIADSASD
jgi:hypothetical protein